jgi:hypothetical protein
VQGELSLDKIKVVRNDLSDADLEVVPARRPVVLARGVPGLQAEARGGAAESAWERVTTRVLGAGQSQADDDR